MRIGIFTDSYKPYISGVSTSVFMLAEGLIKEGHEVFVITTTYKGYKEYDKDYNYIKRIRGVKLPRRGAGFLKYVPFVNRHLKMIKKLNLDVIHIHTELKMGTLALNAKEKFNIPVVYTVHTMYEEYMHFVSKILARYYQRPLMGIVKYLMRKFITNADLTIVPSQKIKDLMLSYEIEADYNIVPTGINLDQFKRETYKEEDILKIKENLNLKEDEFICLYVGRISIEKDIDMLIEGFKEIEDEKIKFIIVGGGPHLKDLKDKVAKYKLEDKIIFTGLVSWFDIGLYYQIGDVFLNASISETQGLTYIEALAADLPLIVRYDKVLEDVVTDGENGLFFYKQEEIKDKILQLYNDEKLRETLKENAGISVVKYDQETYVKSAYKIYERAIKKANEK